MSDKIMLSKATFAKLTGNANTNYSNSFTRNGANTIVETKARTLDKKIMYKFDENGDVILDNQTYSELKEAYNKKNAINMSHLKIEQDLEKTKEQLETAADELINKANSFVNSELANIYKKFKDELENIPKKINEKTLDFHSVLENIEKTNKEKLEIKDEIIMKYKSDIENLNFHDSNLLLSAEKDYKNKCIKIHLIYIIVILLIIIFILLFLR